MNDRVESDKMLGFLDWCELAIRRITSGLFQFVIVTLPEWAREVFRRLAAFVREKLREAWQELMWTATYLARVGYKITRVSFFAWCWGMVTLLPLVLAIAIGSGLLILISLLWLALAMVGSFVGYRCWRKKEEVARMEWRDMVLKGRTIQEWVDVVTNQRSSTAERNHAVLTLICGDVAGRNALSTILVSRDAFTCNASAELSIIAAIDRMGNRAAAFGPMLAQVCRVSANPQIRDAARNTLARLDVGPGSA